MGTLAYALGGAIGGAGQGLAKVGEEGMKEQLISKEHDWQDAHDRTMEQLRAQQAENLQAKGQTFQHGETQERLKAAVGAASATRQFEQGENEKNRASREKVGAGHDIAKEDTAAISAYSRTGGKSTVKPFLSRTLSTTPQGPDGKPILGALPEQHLLTYDPNTGIHYVQQGDRFYEAGADGKPVIDAKATSRAVNPESLRHLLANPYAKIPDSITIPRAFKGAGTFKPENAGMTYLEAFKQEHGFIPTAILGTVNKLSQQQTSSQGFRLPSGRMFNGPGGGGGEEGDSDTSNSNEEQGADQPFQSGANQTFGNVAGE